MNKVEQIKQRMSGHSTDDIKQMILSDDGSKDFTKYMICRADAMDPVDAIKCLEIATAWAQLKLDRNQ